MFADSPGLAALSVTFRDAPSATRACLSEPVDPDVFRRLCDQGVSGLVEVHTCARSMWVVSARHAAWAGGLLQTLVAQRLRAADPRSRVFPTLRTQDDALRHVLSVAVGLDSFVQGEADIGGQTGDAFASAHELDRTDPVLNLVWQAVGRLLSEGREHGFIRPNRGLGALAVDVLRRAGADPARPVAVVGSGAIGQRVMGALERANWPRTLYNRTPGPGRLSLAALGGPEGVVHEAIVVCTAGPSGWFLPPASARIVVDLGLPAQVTGASLGLDVLLDGTTGSGEGLRLPPEIRARAELAVEREIAAVTSRVRAQRWARGLERLNRERDQFVRDRLESVLGDGLAELSPELRRRVLAQGRFAVRQLTHTLIEALKEELTDLNPAQMSNNDPIENHDSAATES